MNKPNEQPQRALPQEVKDELLRRVKADQEHPEQRVDAEPFLKALMKRPPEPKAG